MHCWCNICHGTQITDNSRICHCLLFHEHGKQNFMQQFHLSRKLLRYTHTWTKLHNNVMSWISGAYECHYAWSLPEVNATTVCDLTVLSVGSLPLSVMVCSCAFTEHGFVLAHVQIWNPFAHLNFRYMATSRHTYIHTHQAMQSR